MSTVGKGSGMIMWRVGVVKARLSTLMKAMFEVNAEKVQYELKEGIMDVST